MLYVLIIYVVLNTLEVPFWFIAAIYLTSYSSMNQQLFFAKSQFQNIQSFSRYLLFSDAFQIFKKYFDLKRFGWFSRLNTNPTIRARL